MNTSIGKRERLHQYIDVATNHDVDELFDYIENSLKPEVSYNKWDEPEFLAEMDKRVKAMENGSDKGYTWEEVKDRARQALKSKTAK